MSFPTLLSDCEFKVIKIICCVNCELLDGQFY